MSEYFIRNLEDNNSFFFKISVRHVIWIVPLDTSFYSQLVSRLSKHPKKPTSKKRKHFSAFSSIQQFYKTFDPTYKPTPIFRIYFYFISKLFFDKIFLLFLCTHLQSYQIPEQHQQSRRSLRVLLPRLSCNRKK